MYVEEIQEKRTELKVIKYKSCSRCGEIGHTSENCPNKILSLKQMKKNIEENIKKAIEVAPSTWVSDSYGLYMPSTEEIIKEKRSWKDGKFCFNCGEFGHEIEECTKPKEEQFEKVVIKKKKK